MAAIAPALMPIIGAAATESMGAAAVSLVTAGLGGIASRQTQSESNKAAQIAANQQLAEIERRRVADERKKRTQLKHQQAKQRARFGASGLLASGSADAVLDTLRKETEQSIADGRAGDRYRIIGINQDLDDARQTSRRTAQTAIQENLLKITRPGEWTYGKGE